jgi:peptidoglycan/xylan/chitin deacetylase (PgdA/CDA1 family)
MVSLVIARGKIILAVVLLSFSFSYLAIPVIVFSQPNNENDTMQSNSNSDRNNVNLDKNQPKVVILTFDGGHKGQYTNAKPVLDRYGFKATFHVVCDYTQKGGDARMNWTEVRELYKQGYDIGSNTMNHYVLTQLPTEKMEHEVSASKQCLLDQGINATSLAYPYNRGSTTSAVVNTVAEYYHIARSAGDPLMFLDCSLQGSENENDTNNEEDDRTATTTSTTTVMPTDCRPYSKGQDESTIKTVHRYSIRGWSHEEVRKEHKYDDSQTLQRFIEIVNSQTRFNQDRTINAVPVLIYQKIESVNNKDSGGSPSAATNVELFDAEMKYLYDNGFTVLTMSDLAYDQGSNILQIRDKI